MPDIVHGLCSLQLGQKSLPGFSPVTLHFDFLAYDCPCNFNRSPRIKCRSELALTYFQRCASCVTSGLRRQQAHECRDIIGHEQFDMPGGAIPDRRACHAMGMDPCFGFLHDGRKPGRLSLVWDAVEPLRPRVVRAVFGYVETHEFERADFLVFVHKITLERTIRLTAELAKEIVEVAVKTVSVRECVKTVEWLVSGRQLTKKQEIISETQSTKMDFVIGDFFTLLVESGMGEREAARYVSSLLINAGIGTKLSKVKRPKHRGVSKTCYFEYALKSHEQIEAEAKVIIAKRARH
jgi:CRISPR associated protein, Cas1 family